MTIEIRLRFFFSTHFEGTEKFSYSILNYLTDCILLEYVTNIEGHFFLLADRKKISFLQSDRLFDFYTRGLKSERKYFFSKLFEMFFNEL